jgi:hypothetical protein
MTPGFLSKVTSVFEKAGEEVTLNMEAEGIFRNTGNKVHNTVTHRITVFGFTAVKTVNL